MAINFTLVAFCWFLSLPYVHDARSKSPKILKEYLFALINANAVRQSIYQTSDK